MRQTVKCRLSTVASFFALTACLCLLSGFVRTSQNLAVSVAAATPQITLEIGEINHDSVTVTGTVTDLESVDTAGFEYRLISGSEILWQAKEADTPSLTFSMTLEDLQSSSNYAVRAYYTIGLTIYYSDAQDFSTPEAPAEPTVTPTVKPTPTLTPAPTLTPTLTPTPTETTQTTTARETTAATTTQTTAQSQSETTTAPTDADGPGGSININTFLLIILGIIALALIAIAVALWVNIAKKSKQCS